MHHRRAVLALSLLLALFTGCASGSSDNNDAAPAKESPSAETTSPSPSPSPSSATPTPTPSETPTEAANSDCEPPTVETTVDWETEDVPFPKQNVVRTRWSDADIDTTLTNNSEHTIVLEFALFFISKPRGSQPHPRFPPYSLDKDLDDATVDDGDDYDLDSQPYGVGDWLEQFPIYTVREPHVAVRFSWHYEDDDVQARCVDTPARKVPVGNRPDVLTRDPWISEAHFTKTGLDATARSCAIDTAEVLDGTPFYAEHPDHDDIDAITKRGPIKVPVARDSCRDLALTFPGVTSRDWVIAHPYYDDSVPLRWTLERVK